MAIDNIQDVVIRIPEYIIFEGIQSALKQLRADFASNTDETKSMLYIMLRNVGIQRYQYFKQAKNVFIENDVDSPRALNLQIEGNRQHNEFPSIHVTLPAEQPGQNELSLGQGSMEAYFSDDDNDGHEDHYRPSFTRRFQTVYSIVITSDNENEVILVYHVLRALLIAMTTHFTLAGLENISFSGADLKNYNKELPHNAQVRAINMSFQYQTSTYDFSKLPVVNQMFFSGIPYTLNTNSNP